MICGEPGGTAFAARPAALAAGQGEGGGGGPERPCQRIEGSRRSPFEDLDRPALKPLPAERYEYAERRKARVNIDYHIQVDGRFYSVLHALARRDVEVRLASTTVEIFHRHRRVAAHIRGRRKGGYTTDPGHMPAAHRAHLKWTPSRLVRWARKTGPDAAAFARRLLKSWPHPERGYRSCLGLMRLARAYAAERLEAACRFSGSFLRRRINWDYNHGSESRKSNQDGAASSPSRSSPVVVRRATALDYAVSVSSTGA